MAPDKNATPKKRKVVVLDDSDEEQPERRFSGIVPEGAEVIDLEQLEEQFYAEFDAEQAIPANPAQRTRSTRNLPVVFPWVLIENIKVRDLALKIGKTVELSNEHFLQISKILKSSVTREIRLRGWLLKRTKRMGGVLPLKRNELCFIHEVFSDDTRPILEQSVHEVGLEEVVKTRLLIRTNWPFPAHRAIFHSVSLDKKENEQHAEEHERLVVRWKYVTYYDNAQEQAKSPAYQGNIRKRELLPIDEEECTSPQHYLPPDTQRLGWRGDTSLGGAHNAPVEGVHRTHRNLRRSQNSRAQKYTYADTFCGAGGTTEGAQAAGLHISLGLDCDRNSGLTWRHNFPDADHFEMWSHEFVTLPEHLQRFIVDILHMSPPCQVFSPVHTHEGKNDEQNFASLFACEEIIKKTHPRMITLEQTFGILHPKFQQAFHSLIQMFTSLGFSISWRTVEFQRYGLPQRRRRLVILAAAPGETLPDLPPYTHSDNPSGGLKPYNSVRNALSKIPRNAPNHDVDAAKRRGANKVVWDDTGIATCITCDGGGKGHPSGTRDFTEREIATLQSFPLNHVFLGNAIKKQVGNAVPPLIARIIFLAIKQHLERTDGVVRTIVVD